jgi:hypothetical protein
MAIKGLTKWRKRNPIVVESDSERGKGVEPKETKNQDRGSNRRKRTQKRVLFLLKG